MPEKFSSTKTIKEAEKDISKAHSLPEKMQSLNSAFELFSKETSRIETAYKALLNQYEEINLSLKDTNVRLNNKVAEFHIMMNYLINILNNMSQGMMFVDLSGEITTYNSAAANMLGHDKQKILFNKFWDIFPDKFFGFSMKEALANKQAPATSFITVEKDPGIRNEYEIGTSFVLHSQLDEEKRVEKDSFTHFDFMHGLIILIRDITEVRHLQQIASRNDRMKELGEMAAMVAHEIRNPLGGIKGFASLLVRDLADKPALQDMAKYIVEGTDNLNRLVTDVLNYSRPIQMKFDTLNLVDIMHELRQHVIMDVNHPKNISIEVQANEKKIMASIDQQLFKAMILNLVVNAVQAMPKGGKIRISVERKMKEVIVKVSDTGEGISEENLEKIFSPFFTTKPQGHGFGLAEVFKIVQSHQGTIEVKSEAGKGTTFTIGIPA